MASLRKRSGSWYVRYRDEHGQQHEVKAGPDQAMARRIGAELESRVQGIRTGATDPRERAWADAERKPLTAHVHDWHATLIAKGRKPRYADLARDRTLRLIETAKAFRVSHLSLSAIQTAVGDLRKLPGRCGNVGLSDRTVFHHVRAIKMFSKWLWRDGRLREDPLVHLSPPTVVHKRERRALETEDAARLIVTTPTQPRRYGLSGEDRVICYALALGTGYRAEELRNLTPEDFDLDHDPPTVRCHAAYAKNHTEAFQPIRPDLAAFLRAWVASRTAGQRIFGNLTDKTAEMLRRDLAAAGIENAHVYDFHCLRHTFVTALIRSGASIKVVQALARHADPAMTLGVYTHVQVYDLARGLDGLPALTLAADQAEVKTGTYDNTLAHTLPTPPVSKGRKGTDPTSEKPLKIASHCVPSRQDHRSTEPKVIGSNPIGCIYDSLRQGPHSSATQGFAADGFGGTDIRRSACIRPIPPLSTLSVGPGKGQGVAYMRAVRTRGGGRLGLVRGRVQGRERRGGGVDVVAAGPGVAPGQFQGRMPHEALHDSGRYPRLIGQRGALAPEGVEVKDQTGRVAVRDAGRVQVDPEHVRPLLGQGAILFGSKFALGRNWWQLVFGPAARVVRELPS